LWLDDLFPKARFLDALAMVEKTGHKRQLQAMRMEWINEGKPRSSVHEDSIFDQPTLPPRLPSGQEKPAPPIAPIFQKAATDRPKTPTPDSNMDMEMEMDDLYDATPRAPRQNQAAAQSQNSIFGGGIAASGSADVTSDVDGPPDDDLDALLAEEEMIQAETSRPNAGASGGKSAIQEDSFEDDMEAMAEMEGLW
jgi:replication fork protection complex subunit Csm3/Swi3